MKRVASDWLLAGRADEAGHVPGLFQGVHDLLRRRKMGHSVPQLIFHCRNMVRDFYMRRKPDKTKGTWGVSKLRLGGIMCLFSLIIKDKIWADLIKKLS